MFIRSYRVRGHLHADLDPLGLEKRPPHSELDPKAYGFREQDMDTPILLNGVLGLQSATMREIEERLKKVYATHIGVEFMHIQDAEQKKWIQLYVENNSVSSSITNDCRKNILRSLACADLFEGFLKTKFPGAKRFGLEGGESLIPGLNSLLETAVNLGVEDISFGMAHRGRLNLLANVMHKPLDLILFDFLEKPAPNNADGHLGDVKYHKGASIDRVINGKTIHLNLAYNPSHLEAVNPVVAGRVRSKQEYISRNKDKLDTSKIMGLLIHGDAAFAGQGLVAESLMLSELPGYSTGGIVHVIINNQIGFTTKPKHGRSSPYPSDVMKMIQAPVLHVNGDDPEAVTYCFKLAMEFRQKFQKDVLIDLYCYRRMGHNEMDEPGYTQPLMYAKIAEHPSVYAQYSQTLSAQKLMDDDALENLENTLRNDLEAAFTKAQKTKTPPKPDWLAGAWANIKNNSLMKTAITDKIYNEVAKVLTAVPQGFNVHPKLQRQLEQKQELLTSGENLDWSLGEALAFGSLVKEGYNVRLSGQDSGRGTFSHRHGRWVDTTNEQTHTPIAQIKGGGKFDLVDSPLAEASVMGFEYGFSLNDPRNVVMWEAQFGDFCNGAQVIIDQFISCAESKWHRLHGLILLLPHGYEGQGAEHSSARPERFLQMSARDNWTVANCTTPANLFHIIRRQVTGDKRRPLILMTPKSLLRHKLAVSSKKEITGASAFQPVIDDPSPPKTVKRVVLCTGKIYYDLLSQRLGQKATSNVALVRVEQLYPFPEKELFHTLKKYPKAGVVWCQEEPQNMGAWTYIDRRIEAVLQKLKSTQRWPQVIARPEGSAPATGYAVQHEKEQSQILTEALKVS